MKEPARVRQQPQRIPFPAAILAVSLLLIPAGIAGEASGAPGGDAWVMQYPDCGSCDGSAVAATADGGFIIGGSTLQEERKSALLLFKTDRTGNRLWTLKGDGDSCEGNALAGAGPKRTAAAGGGCGAGVAGATLIIADDATGAVVRNTLYDAGTNATGTAVIGTGDGGHLLAMERSQGATGRDVIIRRLDKNGVTVWSRAFTGPLEDTARAVTNAADGGYVIAGSTVMEGLRYPDILLIRLGADGTPAGTWTFGGQETSETAAGILLTPDGGYLVAGSSCRPKTGDCDIYAVRTDPRGLLLWEQYYGGSGRDDAAAVLPAADGGFIIAGSSDSPDRGARDRDIHVLKIDGSGTEQWSVSFGTAAYDYVGGALLTADGKLVLAGHSAAPVDDGTHTLFLAMAGDEGRDPPAGMLQPGDGERPEGGMQVRIRDAVTGAGIPGARVYLDGNLRGETSPDTGSIALKEPAPGDHSLRVTGSGYREATVIAPLDREAGLTVRLQPSPIHKLSGAGPPGQSLDIVFVPSETSYDCSREKSIPAQRYTGSPDQFLADVERLVANRLLQLERHATAPSKLPDGYRERLNIYYYWDGDHFADAFAGCAGRLPDGFYDDAPFTDAAVILYPDTPGSPSDGSCDPAGCASAPGPGPYVYLKTPAGQGMVFLHESGHAMFGLMDTYSGPTYYIENLPYPNIWESMANCTRDARADGGNPSRCRPIAEGTGGQQGGYGAAFWKFDPEPDLMGSTAMTAKFGDASLRRILYVFDTLRGG